MIFSKPKSERRALSRMSCIESRTVPDTVQLIVEVAGLWYSAPAFDVIRPAGIAPRCSAHRNRSYHSLAVVYGDVRLSAREPKRAPAIAEPLFAGLNAEIEVIPAMNADDLKKGLGAPKSA
jgi:hypothetical protein